MSSEPRYAPVETTLVASRRLASSSYQPAVHPRSLRRAVVFSASTSERSVARDLRVGPLRVIVGPARAHAVLEPDRRLSRRSRPPRQSGGGKRRGRFCSTKSTPPSERGHGDPFGEHRRARSADPRAGVRATRGAGPAPKWTVAGPERPPVETGIACARRRRWRGPSRCRQTSRGASAKRRSGRAAPPAAQRAARPGARAGGCRARAGRRSPPRSGGPGLRITRPSMPGGLARPARDRGDEGPALVAQALASAGAQRPRRA